MRPGGVGRHGIPCKSKIPTFFLISCIITYASVLCYVHIRVIFKRLGKGQLRISKGIKSKLFGTSAKFNLSFHFFEIYHQNRKSCEVHENIYAMFHHYSVEHYEICKFQE